MEDSVEEESGILHQFLAPVYSQRQRTILHVQQESNLMKQHVNDKTEHLFDEIEHMMYEAEHVTEETEYVVHETDHVDNETLHLIDDTEHVVGETKHMDYETEHVIDETEHVIHETELVIDKTKHMIDETEHVDLQNDHMLKQADIQDFQEGPGEPVRFEIVTESILEREFAQTSNIDDDYVYPIPSPAHFKLVVTDDHIDLYDEIHVIDDLKRANVNHIEETMYGVVDQAAVIEAAEVDVKEDDMRTTTAVILLPTSDQVFENHHMENQEELEPENLTTTFEIDVETATEVVSTTTEDVATSVIMTTTEMPTTIPSKKTTVITTTTTTTTTPKPFCKTEYCEYISSLVKVESRDCIDPANIKCSDQLSQQQKKVKLDL